MTSHAAYLAAEAAWGDHEPEPVLWTSGPWSIEIRGDELADIRFDGSLVLRSIRAVARDRDWGTVPVTVERVELVETSLTLNLRMRGLGADLDATLTISAADTLTVHFAATSLTEFERNRLGLVVLHPPSVAGAELTVATSAGEVHTCFPVDIAPHQPALDIAGLRWQAEGITAELAFEGDTFEMEDQRNWADASFKTYSTPLALPFPVRLQAGTRIEQSLSLRCARVAPAATDALPAPVTFEATARRIPELGGTLIVELDPSTVEWGDTLDRAAGPLDVRIVAASPSDVFDVLDAVAGHPVARLGVFSSTSHVTEPALWSALQSGAAERGIHADLVGGARSHFTELNRELGRLPELPALTFSLTPQMHATERAQLVESIAMQRLVAHNAVRLAAGRPVHVGPVTLRPRFNAVATSGASEPIEPDPRETSTAFAAWVIASAAALSVDGVASVSYPQFAADLPVASALRDLQELAGHPLLEPSQLPPNVWMLAAETPAGPVALVANLNATPVSLALAAPFGAVLTLAPLAVRRHPKTKEIFGVAATED